MIPDYDIQIWRNVNGVCTQIDIDENIVNPPEPRPEDPEELETYTHNFLMSELISIKAVQTVAGQVAEADVVFDNDPTKKFSAGDLVIIWLGWEESTLQKIFSGVVYEAAKYSSDEDKTLTLRVRDWSFLLLTDKFSRSYPDTENARQIVLDILGSFGKILEGSYQTDADDGYLYVQNGDYETAHDAASGTVEDEDTVIKIGQICEVAQTNRAVNDYIEIINDGWTFNGSFPYLDAIDDNYIEHEVGAGITDQFIAKFDYQDIPTWVTITGRQFWLVGRTTPGNDMDVNLECLLSIDGVDFWQIGFIDFLKDENTWIQKGLSLNTYPFNTWTPAEWNNVVLKLRMVGGAGTGTSAIQITESHIVFTYSSNYRYTIERGSLFFDTSNIPDEAEIASAYLTLYPTAKTITQDFDLQLQIGESEYPHKPLIGDDYEASRYSGNLGSIDGVLIEVGYFFNIEVDINYIVKDGITKLVLRTTPDISSTAPGSGEIGEVQIASFDHGTPSFRPVLHVLYYSPSVGLCEYKVGISDLIESSSSTRQLDFDGEPLIDAMTKVSDVTEHDWYIDEEKMARWFPRRDVAGHRQYRDDPPTVPLTLGREDFIDYNVTDPEELLCNKVKVYGRNNKVIPWDYDGWTDSLGSESDPFEWVALLGCDLSLQASPPTPKKGIYTIKIGGKKSSDWFEWTKAEGWCHTVVPFGPGSLEFAVNFTCPSGKKLRFNKAGCTHEQSGWVEIYYKWGESGSWIRLTYPDDKVQSEDQDLYPLGGAPWYVEGTVNTDLYIKWKLTGMGLFQTGCMYNFRVYYGDDSVTYTEKFSARLRIPAPKVIFNDGGTNFFTLISGVPENDTEEKKKGASSYKTTLTAEALDFYHDYFSDTDWGIKPNIGIWIYGQDTGKVLLMEFWNEVYSGKTNGYRYSITDDFLGWKWFEPLRTDFTDIGTPTGWDKIRCIRFNEVDSITATFRFDWWINFDPLDQTVDLETKASPQTLVFVAAPHYGIFPSGITQFLVRFIFAGGGSATTQVQFYGIKADNWTTIEVPVGPDADGWTEECSGTLEYIELELTAPFDSVPSDEDYILIDWLHFADARWFGENEDVESQISNGVRFKELFDDTLYSDTAASRKALEYIKKFKDPIVTIKDVEVDYIGQENLDPGKVLIISDSIPEFAGLSEDQRTYRIESIEHHFEENDYYVKLILSLDPIYFEGNVYQISERVRRIEQKGRRKPAANPVEVD